MICQVNIMPDYINSLDISPASKQQARNVHVSVVNELMNLKTKDNYNVFQMRSVSGVRAEMETLF